MKIVYREKSLFAQITGTPSLPFVAESVALGPVSWIRIGPGFLARPDDQCEAIIVHERGHIAGWHSLMRVLWLLVLLPMWAPEWVERQCLQQEFEADDYARRRGHGPALLRALKSMRGVYHDAFLDDRIARLEFWVRLP
ncbi:MAG: hypothetical protein ACTHJ9_17295 [Rhodanobacter sp.]